MICKLVASAFVLADFYPPPCFVKFIGYVWASPAAFRVGPVGQMEGNWFHLCASALFHACAEGLAVADEFHVPQSFRLAAAIAPRRREKSARHQFSPLGKAVCALKPVSPAGSQNWFLGITSHAGTRTDSFRLPERKPDADCGRGRLAPRFSPREPQCRIRCFSLLFLI